MHTRRFLPWTPSWLATGVITAVAPDAASPGARRLTVTESITVEAPPDAVWARIRDFDALQDWHPAIAESPANQGNTPGSVRALKVRGGGELTETLTSHDDANRRYAYRADDGGALPVTRYTSTLAVSGAGDRATVEWRGEFQRAHPGDDPPPEANDEAAVAAITGVYQAGLAHLKQLAEAR